ncbi:MAG: chromosome segregation protein SMC [Acidobacteriota bacterium]
MHRLERIQLVGFKSFVDKTEIHFNDGITCVIGPNGCGKSNIADAIAWVLGEQSARTLRGQNMQDVIFSGTARQKPSGYAEVTLALRAVRSDVEVSDPIETDRAEVTRRLYRSGESEYLLNNKKCRLKDIHEMFEGTGLGFSSYALIEQGRIGSILSAKPLERRSLIEEAARIVSFKHRRRAAELKLEMAQQNLLRINDIMVEIERNLRSLKRQASKARVFARLRDRLRREHQLLLGRQYRALDDELQQARGALENVLERDRGMVEELRLSEDQLRAEQLEAGRLQHELEQARERLSELSHELDRDNHLAGYQKEQEAATEKRLEILRLERAQTETHLARHTQELGYRQGECERIRQELEEYEGQLQQRRQAIEELERSIVQSESRLEIMRRAAINDAADTASLRNQSQQGLQHLREGAARLERLEVDAARNRAEQQQLDARKIALDTELRANTEQLAVSRRQEAEAAGAEESLAHRIEELRGQADLLQEKAVGMQQRLHSLEELELRRANYSEGVQKFLRSASGSSLRLSGTLADHVETEAQYEPIFEELLDDELQYVLVDKMEDALAGLSFLKSEHSGRATFLAIHADGQPTNGDTDWETLAGHAGVVGPLGKLLRMNDDVRSAFKRALPHLAGAAVVSDMPTALGLSAQFPNRTFITLEGEQLSPRGLLTGIGEARTQIGLLSLKREKKDLVQTIEAARRQLALAQQQAEGARLQHEQMRRRRHEMLQNVHDIEKEAVALEHRSQGLAAEIARAAQALELFVSERDQLLARRVELDAALEGISAALGGLETEQGQRETSLVETQRQVEEQRRQVVESGRALSELQSAGAARSEQLKHASDAVTRLRLELDESRNRLRRLDEERDAGQESIRKLVKSQQALARRAAQLAEESKELEASIEAQQAEAARRRQLAVEVDERIRLRRADRELVLEERSKLEIDKAHRESELEHIERTAEEEHQKSAAALWEELGAEASTREREVIAAEYAQLKERLEQFGPINMTALDEYQEHEQRHQFLHGQRIDIEASIGDTTATIQEINQRSRAQFLEAFEQVNIYFKEMFQVLFAGGECGMQLMDESDVLESGIDIYAQPPGKRLQNVMLLSGGEKALTAFALLLALFQYRPSPFCLLDEVDAPLDDANVQRFTQLVQYMTRKTQFIIITHNKRTMEISNSLYGITMEQPGISQVVSVNFSAPPVGEPEPVGV